MFDHDVVVIGAGPAGLSAALNLVRARRRVLLVDSNRPRNAATLRSHGFITRDGVSPLELRRLGRDEFASYDGATVHSGLVTSVTELANDDGGPAFTVTARGIRGDSNITVTTAAVLVATGLAETLPALPSIRAWYGTSLHSCIECDGYEKTDAALALIGETADLAERALLVSQFSSDLIVFTNGSAAAVSAEEERSLAASGVSVDRRVIDDVIGEAGRMTAVQLADGTVVARDGGFVRPTWNAPVEYLDSLAHGHGPERDDDGLLVVDAGGRTSVAGIYAAGDSTPPGPEQLIIAAGEAARTARSVNRDLIGAGVVRGR